MSTYTGSHHGLPQLILIGHLLQNLCIGEARVCGVHRVERTIYNPTYRQNAGADVVALLRHDAGVTVYLWQVRARDLAKPGPLTKAARVLLALGFDPLKAGRDRALHESITGTVPGLMQVEV